MLLPTVLKMTIIILSMEPDVVVHTYNPRQEGQKLDYTAKPCLKKKKKSSAWPPQPAWSGFISLLWPLQLF
jgi:hypothetical protein